MKKDGKEKLLLLDAGNLCSFSYHCSSTEDFWRKSWI